MNFNALPLIAALFLGACVQSTTGGATERAICQVWGNSLPTRSRADTTQTQAEIQEAYADFAAACPAFSALIPN